MHAKCFLGVCASGCAVGCVCVLLIFYILKKKFLLQFHCGVINRMGDGSQAGKWNVTIRGHIVYVSFHSETVLPIAPLYFEYESPSPSPHPGCRGTFHQPYGTPPCPPHTSARGVLDERGALRRWRQVKREFDGETAARVCEAWLKLFSVEQFIHHLRL